MEDKILKLNLEGHKVYLEILRIFSNLKNPKIEPYSSLRNRELEVLSVITYMYNEKYSKIPDKERNTLVFSYDSRQEVADTLGVSNEVVYNIMMDLRKKGFLEKNKVNKKLLIPPIKSLTLKFK